MPSSVAEVVTLIRDAVAKHNPDAALAKSLHKLKLTERLDDHTVEELESEGVGPKAAVELERLRDASHALPAPVIAPQFPHDGVPSVPDQRRIVAAAQQIALNYAKSLPDFICTEVIRRYDDTRGGFDLRDTLEVKLTYFDQQENYRLLTVNGRPTHRNRSKWSGARCRKGEFGSMLVLDLPRRVEGDLPMGPLDDAAQTHRARIFVPHPSGEFHVPNAVQHGPGIRQIGNHRGAARLRLRGPGDQPDPPDRGRGRQYSARLPRQAVLNAARLRLHGCRRPVVSAPDSRRGADGNEYVHTRNLVEFHGYRKFAGESTITYQD